MCIRDRASTAAAARNESIPELCRGSRLTSIHSIRCTPAAHSPAPPPQVCRIPTAPSFTDAASILHANGVAPAGRGGISYARCVVVSLHPVPAEFTVATESIRALEYRSDLQVQEIRPPEGLAPHSYALSADVATDGTTNAGQLGTGRFILLLSLIHI